MILWQHTQKIVDNEQGLVIGFVIESRYSIPGVSPMNAGLIAPAMLLPAIQSARGSARRVQSMNNMKQIQLAILIHEQAKNRLPSNIVAKDGTPLLSWRVRLLPYIDKGDLYKQFRLDEPWNSDHNKKLAVQIPLFTSPRGTPQPEDGMFKTPYLAVADESGVFPPKGSSFGIGAINDGTSNTVAFVEANASAAIVWTKPDDLPLDNTLPGKLQMGGNGFLAAFCDGSIQTIPFDVAFNAKILKGIFTRNGKEPSYHQLRHRGAAHDSRSSSTLKARPMGGPISNIEVDSAPAAVAEGTSIEAIEEEIIPIQVEALPAAEKTDSLTG